MGDATSAFAEASAALLAARADFMLVGATAFGFYTLPRATYDLDFLVGEDERVRAALRRSFLMVEETRDIVFGQRAWVVELPLLVTPVELFFATHWFTRQALARKRDADLQGRVIGVASPEDLLLLKAANAVHPARPQYKQATDRADVGLLLDARPELDLAYLAQNASRLGEGVAAYLRACGLALP